MKIFLVGGAVRDQLLGLPDSDKDWVVVGATPQQMLDRGFTAVGKDFPVFLHPETKEEYALARKERKTGVGYGGFDFNIDTSVSLEQDLERRDLTINAMARSDEGELIDPYGGQQDLAQRRLRHVSDAFAEDPLRVLRVARFYARFHHLGFEIAPSTFKLLQVMCASGELAALSPDRLWSEMQKGLMEAAPQVFIDCLYRCGAIEALIPELAAQFNRVDALANAEPQIGARITTALAHAHKTAMSLDVRWAILCHVLDAAAVGSAAGPRNLALNPPANFESTVAKAVCERFRATKKTSRLCVLANGLLPSVLIANQLRPDYLLQLLESCDAFRESSLLEESVQLAQAINATDPDAPLGQLSSINFLLEAKRRCASVSAQQYVEAGLKGADIAAAIKAARKMVLKELLSQR